jgi:hypothetical protein
VALGAGGVRAGLTPSNSTVPAISVRLVAAMEQACDTPANRANAAAMNAGSLKAV